LKSKQQDQTNGCAPASTVKPAHKPDLFAILRDHYTDDQFLSDFWKDLHEVPEWVDWEWIERGQKFFSRYFVANCSLFAFQAFVRDNTVCIRPRPLNLIQKVKSLLRFNRHLPGLLKLLLPLVV
jgi:hypothetical protein